jgi:hypothetical protein
VNVATLSTTNPNTIAFNGGPGINVDGADNPSWDPTQRIQRQSIHSNAGLGIDLTNGGNINKAAPTIGGFSGGTVTGFACPGCTVDVYSDSDGEGRFYHATATANGLGQWSATSVTPVSEQITATATDAQGNTSEFSVPLVIAEPCDGVDNDGDGQTDEGNPNTDLDGQANCIDGDDDNDTHPDTTDGCVLLAEDVDGFDDSDGCPDSDNDLDGVCDPGQVSIACSGSDTGSSCFDPAGTLSCGVINCANVAEDYDAFHDGDGCPEPDNDNDGRPDAIDTCPGDDSVAGPDGMLGAPQDLNHNGIRNGSEAAFSTDDGVLTFEDYDGVLDADGCHDSPGDDFDGDGLTDDSEVFTHLTLAFNPDSDADGVLDGPDNCRLWPNPGQSLPNLGGPVLGTGGDSDCDRFTNTREQYLGTNPTQHCAANTGANNEPAPDHWPLDLNDNRTANTLDVGQFVFVLNETTAQAGSTRLDFNGNGTINTLDVGAYVFVLNRSCSLSGP